MRPSLTSRLNYHLRRHFCRRAPDFIVGSPAAPYLLRWYILPWRGWLPNPATRMQRFAKAILKRLPNLYLHCFLRPDEDRAHHDHPSFAASWVLENGYIEHTIRKGGVHDATTYDAGSIRFFGLVHPHRIDLYRLQAPHLYMAHSGRDYVIEHEPVWTLFLFFPAVRDWGFHCPERGWVPWWEFVKPGSPGERGRGCD